MKRLLLVITIVLFLAAPIFAETEEKYCIDDLIQSIYNNNTKIRKADEDVVQAHLDTKDAEAGYQPTIELTLMGMYMANPFIDDITINTNDILMQMGMAPIPQSYDITLFDGIGHTFYNASISITQPLLTWGKITNSVKLFKAAESAREMQRADIGNQLVTELKARLAALVYLSDIEELLGDVIDTSDELVSLAKKGSVYSVSLRKIRFHGDMLRRILRYGMPAGIQNSVIGLANVIVQTQINSFAKLAMAAYGSQSKIEGFAFMPITSFSMAITTFISQNLGAQKYDRARKGARFGIISAVVLAELIGVLYYIFAPALIGIFDDNPGVIAYGVQQARTAALFYFLLAFSHSVAAVCRGSGKAFVPMLIMFSVWCVLRVAYIAVVMRLFGEIGYIYWAYPITWAISSVIYLFYFLFSDWIHGFDPKVPKAKKA